MAAFVEIRRAVPAERRALGNLHRRSSYVWEEDRTLLDRHPEVLGVDPLAIADGRVRVALGADGTPVGFATVAGRDDGDCELVDLFVEPELMRRGVGQALLEDALACAAKGGHRRMTVVAHARTVPFYERCGFVAGEPVQTRFAPAVRLWRDLGPPSDAS